MKQKIFALIDCNSFYCSCERLFRPDIKTSPVGVLSNNDGCFISRSRELKAIGVKMGEPYFKVKSLCIRHNVVVFSANFSLYSNLSDRVMRVLATFTPELEIYSIDEAFLDLRGFDVADIGDYACEIKRTVERMTGIPVSVGVGFTKTLAKVANHLAKKSEKANGVVTLLNDRLIDIALSRTRVEDIWGVGRATASKLRSMGIDTAKKFRDYENNNYIQKRFSIVGLKTKEELEGKVRFELEIIPTKKKEIICSRTFGKAVFDISSLRESVSSYVTSACEKLRRQDSSCSRVEVYTRTSPYKNAPQYYAFESRIMDGDTANTLKVIRYALEAVDKLYRQGYEYKKAGVRLSKIVDSSEMQLSLFSVNDNEKTMSLMKVLDQINSKEGANTVRSAACGINNHAWKMKQNFKSQRFVSGYSELPKVK